jgi:short-subunit dehydrogenase
MARVHAARRWDLILTARRQAPLEVLATELRAGGATVTVLTADLAEPRAAQGLVDRIAAQGLVVDEIGRASCRERVYTSV